MFEDTEGTIRVRKSKKNRQHNGQKKNDKQRSTKHTHKTRDQVTRTPTKNQGWEVPATLIVVFAMYLAYKERQLIIVFRLVVWVFSHVLSCMYFQV